jgi:uncharacterized membrane protein
MSLDPGVAAVIGGAAGGIVGAAGSMIGAQFQRRADQKHEMRGAIGSILAAGVAINIRAAELAERRRTLWRVLQGEQLLQLVHMLMPGELIVAKTTIAYLGDDLLVEAADEVLNSCSEIVELATAVPVGSPQDVAAAQERLMSASMKLRSAGAHWGCSS